MGVIEVGSLVRLRVYAGVAIEGPDYVADGGEGSGQLPGPTRLVEDLGIDADTEPDGHEVREGAAPIGDIDPKVIDRLLAKGT
jgi:hypothetical protein